MARIKTMLIKLQLMMKEFAEDSYLQGYIADLFVGTGDNATLDTKTFRDEWDENYSKVFKKQLKMFEKYLKKEAPERLTEEEYELFKATEVEFGVDFYNALYKELRVNGGAETTIEESEDGGSYFLDFDLDDNIDFVKNNVDGKIMPVVSYNIELSSDYC